MDAADVIGIGVDDAVGHRLGDGGADIAQLLHGGVELGGEGRGGGAGKGLVAAAAGKLQLYVVLFITFLSLNKK